MVQGPSHAPQPIRPFEPAGGSSGLPVNISRPTDRLIEPVTVDKIRVLLDSLEVPVPGANEGLLGNLSKLRNLLPAGGTPVSPDRNGVGGSIRQGLATQVPEIQEAIRAVTSTMAPADKLEFLEGSKVVTAELAEMLGRINSGAFDADGQTRPELIEAALHSFFAKLKDLQQQAVDKEIDRDGADARIYLKRVDVGADAERAQLIASAKDVISQLERSWNYFSQVAARDLDIGAAQSFHDRTLLELRLINSQTAPAYIAEATTQAQRFSSALDDMASALRAVGQAYQGVGSISLDRNDDDGAMINGVRELISKVLPQLQDKLSVELVGALQDSKFSPDELRKIHEICAELQQSANQIRQLSNTVPPVPQPSPAPGTADSIVRMA